jgi:hypothetical protein
VTGNDVVQLLVESYKGAKKLQVRCCITMFTGCGLPEWTDICIVLHLLGFSPIVFGAAAATVALLHLCLQPSIAVKLLTCAFLLAMLLLH